MGASPLTASGTQEPEEQNSAATQSSSRTHWSLQLPVVASQMPLRQFVGLLQGPWVTTPHLPSAAQTPERHVALLEHVAPMGRPGVHVPSRHRPPRHPGFVMQLSPSSPPHLLSVAQTPDRHWVLRAQLPELGPVPFGKAGAQRGSAASQNVPAPHCESALHESVHCPLAHASLRQTFPELQVCPSGRPHWF